MNRNNDWLNKLGNNNHYKRICLLVFSLLFFFFCCKTEAKASARLSRQKVTLRTGSVYVLKLDEATQSVKWMLSSQRIVEIVYAEPDQVIVRAKKPGVVKLSATIGTKKRICTITVKKEVSFPKTKTILVGDKIRLKAPSLGKWKMSKDSIATLSKKIAKSNSVKALKTGRVTVSIRTLGKTYKCKLKVVDIPKENVLIPNDFPPEESEEKTADLFPNNLVGKYAFGSGAGAWGSSLTLSQDGSFKAEFNNTDMSSGDGYSYSRYVGSCSGRFEVTQILSPLCFEMKIVGYKDEIEQGTTWISEGCKFTATGVVGLGSADRYAFYIKGSPRDTLPEDLRNGRIGIWFTDDGLLGTNFIYNVNAGSVYSGPY